MTDARIDSSDTEACGGYSLERHNNMLSYRRETALFFSYGIKIWNDLSSVLSQSTHVTDRRTEISSQYRVCITCSAVKTMLMKSVNFSSRVSVRNMVSELAILVAVKKMSKRKAYGGNALIRQQLCTNQCQEC